MFKIVRARIPLLAAITLVCLGTAVYLAIDLSRSGRKEVISQFKAMQVLLAQEAVHELTGYLRTCAQDLSAQESLVVSHNPGQLGEEIHRLYQLSKHSPPLSIRLVNDLGSVLFSTNLAGGTMNYSTSEMLDWARNRENQGKVFITSLVQSGAGEASPEVPRFFLMGTPVYRPNPNAPPGRGRRTWAGVLVMALDLPSAITEHLAILSPNMSQRVWIMNRDGTILLQSEHPRMARENIRRLAPACTHCHDSFDYAEKMLAARKPDATEYQLRGGPVKLASYAPLSFANVEWIVVVNVPQAEVTAFLNKNFAKTLLLLGILGGGISLAAWLFHQTNISKVRAQEEARQWQDKHRLLEQIRRTEERYRALFEQSPDGIVVIDPKTTLPIEFNEAAHQHLGYTREEMARLRIADYQAARLLSLPSESAGSRFETIHQTKKGQPRNVEVIAQNLELENQTVLHCIYHDITERKTAEEALERRTAQLAALYQVSLGIAAEMEPQTLFQRITHEAVTLFQGMAGGLFLHHPDRAALELVVSEGRDDSAIFSSARRGEDLVGRVWQSGSTLVVTDYPHWEGRGNLASQQPFAAAMAAPIRWTDKFLGVLAVSSNRPGFFSQDDAYLLGLFATQAAIAIRNSSLVEQVRRDAAIKTTLLHDVNHRVKNNLMRLVEIVRLERESASLAQTGIRDALGGLESRLHGMEVVHEMLSGAHWHPLPLHELITRILSETLNSSALGHRIRLSVATPSDPLWVLPEQATAVGLIVNELTTNSLKYAFHQRGEGRLEVRLQVEDRSQPRPRIRLEFRDDGPGWPEQALQGPMQSVGLHLIQSSVRSPLRGELTLRNEGGAVAELVFALALPA